MKPIVYCFLFLISWATTAQEQLVVRVTLNTAEGTGIKNVSIRVNGTGNALTDNDGFCQFANLKISHQKTTGDAIGIYASLSGYSIVNNFDIASYILPKDRSLPVNIILAKTAERGKYAIQYIQGVANISLSNVFEAREKDLRKQIDKSADDFKKLTFISQTERQQLQNRIDSLYKQLDIVQKQKEKKNNITEQIARILSSSTQQDTMLTKAYQYAKIGKLTDAQNALNASQIDQEKTAYQQEEALAKVHEALAKKLKANYIAKCLLKAQLYILWSQIIEAEIWYEKAYQANNQNFETLFYYAKFLATLNRPKLPAELYKQALTLTDNLDDKATILNNLGIFYYDNQQKEQALQAYDLALKIREDLAKKNPEQFLPLVASTLNNLGIFYSDGQQKEQALQAFERVLKIYEDLVKKNPEQFLPLVANTLNNLGIFYSDNHQKEQAQQAYEGALKIREDLAKKNPEQFLPYLANTLNNLGSFYSDNQQKEQAQQAFEQTLKIREDLAKKNPEQFLPYLANTLSNLGIFYSDNLQKERAQQVYERALKIREDLAKKNPEQFLPLVASTLNNLGNFYTVNQQKEQALQAFERVLKIYEDLVKNNPEQFLPNVAMTEVNIGMYYIQENQYSKGEGLLLKGLKKYQDLALRFNNPIFWQKCIEIIDFLPKLATIDTIYTQKFCLQQAIIKFYEVYPKTKDSTLASVYGNGAWYALFSKQYKQAEQYALRGLSKDSTQVWIYTNLASALLLQDRWAEAKVIYQEKQNLMGNHNKPLKKAFLSDLEEFEKVEIIHPDFAKVRALLEDKK